MSLAQHKVSKKKQKNLRNVLMLCEKSYWPVVSDSDSILINNKLKLCLAPVKINVPRVPWYLLRSLSKEERKQKQNEVLNSQSPEVVKSYHKAIELRKYLFIGVNSLCKGIEEKTVASCILDADVSPKTLVTHVAELARNVNVPVLAVHYLKESLKSVLGFSSLALGFQKSVEEDNTHEFHDACLHIIKIAKTLETSERQFIVEKKEDSFKNGSNNLLIEEQNTKHLKDNVEITSSDISKNNVSDILQNIYLYRNSYETKVFKPLGKEVFNSQVVEDLSNDNIKLTPTEEEVKKVLGNNRYFKPLIVKKIQSNPNKKRKKIKKKKINEK